MKALSRTLLAAAAIVASSSGVCAEVYGSLTAPPGVYFGAGNPNGNFNIVRENGLELGLRAKNRSSVGPVLIDGSSGVYHVSGGLCGSTCGTGQKAKWNYEFSMHTTDGSLLADYFFVLGVDHDGTGATFFANVDPLAQWGDERYDTASGLSTLPAGALGAQNSQNVFFGDTPGGAFSINATGLYDFVLSAYRVRDQSLVTSVDMTVQVPEPGSIALFGLGLMSLAGLRRRKSR